MRSTREQRRSRHDLARLAVAALNDLPVEPSLLDLGTCGRVTNCFDRRNLGVADAVNRGDTGPRRYIVDVHRASATQGHAAAELRAGHAEHIAQHPEQRCIAIDIHRPTCPVYLERKSHGSLRTEPGEIASESTVTTIALAGVAVLHGLVVDWHFSAQRQE